MKILIAETDIALLQQMKQALEHAGHEVIACSDGLSAWDYLAGAVRSDLLVTRFQLRPGTPPGTALGRHAYSHYPPIPVIYIPSAPERAEYADREHGEILVKPFAVDELVAAVDRLLRKQSDSLDVVMATQPEEGS